MKNLDYSLLEEMITKIGIPESLTGIILKLFKTIILLIIINLLNQIIPKLAKKLISKCSKYLGKEERKIKVINFLFVGSLKFLMYFFAIFKVLQIFGQPLQPILTLSGIGGLSLGFGAQSLVKDVITGLFILMEDQFFVGDTISIGNIKGKVENMNIRTVSVRSLEGDLHVIPNGEIKIITNMSKDYRIIFLNIVVFHKENIDKTIKTLTEVIEEYKDINKDDLLESPNILGVTNITENDFTIRISANCKIGKNLQVERSMRKFIKEKFDKKSINILNI